MQCATHPSVETELACGRCGKSICPRCLVYTPVGARCRECANVRRLPQYNISASYLARGAGAALVTGLVLGGLWGVLLPFGVSFFLGLLGLAASILHLGRPQYAFRAIIGLRSSWLSREILAFGVFAFPFGKKLNVNS